MNKKLGILLVVLALLLTGGTFLRDYQLKRFNFFDPCERYEEETGYQLCNSLIAFKNGGLTGQGIGESTQKYLYLPEAHKNTNAQKRTIREIAADNNFINAPWSTAQLYAYVSL